MTKVLLLSLIVVSAVELRPCVRVADTHPVQANLAGGPVCLKRDGIQARFAQFDTPQPSRRAASTNPSHAWKKSLAVELGHRVSMELVLIGPGSFTMGSDNGNENENPSHTVEITEPFYIGKYEVTQEQWQAVMKANPSFVTGAKLPVHNVSWEECQQFLKQLAKKSPPLPAIIDRGTSTSDFHISSRERRKRLRFSLPTEAEWEYACRAGATTEYCYGDVPNQLSEYGWSQGATRVDLQNAVDAFANSRPHEVGQKRPNAWGLHDMHGNVREWCEDWFGHYEPSKQTNPSGPSAQLVERISGMPPSGVYYLEIPTGRKWYEVTYGRVLRGGSVKLPGIFARSAFRDEASENRGRFGDPLEFSDIGLRVVAYSP